MKKIKARNMWDNSHVFISNSGNGLAVPVYELNKNGQMERKLDKDKKPVFKNKYLDIQEFRHVNDYKNVLAMNGGDASVFPQNQNDQHVDLTQVGSIEDVLNAGAKLKANGMTLDDAIVKFKAIIAGLQAQQAKNKDDKKVADNPKPAEGGQESAEGGQENDKKKMKK